jgi:hypothetical protein
MLPAFHAKPIGYCELEVMKRFAKERIASLVMQKTICSVASQSINAARIRAMKATWRRPVWMLHWSSAQVQRAAQLIEIIAATLKALASIILAKTMTSCI